MPQDQGKGASRQNDQYATGGRSQRHDSHSRPNLPDMVDEGSDPSEDKLIGRTRLRQGEHRTLRPSGPGGE